MNDYEPTNEELDELEEELIRRYDSIEKGTIGRDALLAMIWPIVKLPFIRGQF